MASSSVLLDVLSYIEEIKSACSRVRSSEKNAWMLLGYVEADNKTKTFNLYTINIISEGNVWMHIFHALRNDQIMYAYIKLTDLKDSSSKKFKTFLVHWVGEGVDENEITVCIPHLNEIRNIIPAYDHLVTANRIENLHTNVLTYVTEAQHITTRPDSSIFEFPFEFELKSKKSQNECISSVERAKMRSSLSIETSLQSLTMLKEEFDPKLILTQTPSVQMVLSGSNVKLKHESIPKFKATLLGESGVGKTSIYCCFDRGYPSVPAASSTVPVDCTKKKFEIGEHKFYMEIWDTAGQERFKAFASSWLRNSKVVILVYDITDEQSFVKMLDWLEMAKQFSDLQATYVLLGNKVDLEQRRVVSVERAIAFAEREGLIHMECSGLTGYNIVNLFNQIARRILVVYPHKFARHKDSDISQGSTEPDDLVALESFRDRKSSKRKDNFKNC